MWRSFGAGIAGALIGWQLAKTGAKVVILEAGQRVDRSKGVGIAYSGLFPTIPEGAYPNSPWAPTPSVLDPNSYYVQTGSDLFGGNDGRATHQPCC
jgi:choline dehydrogenase-like flavoprotein